MDREKELAVPPHVFSVWQNLPFRDNAFSCILFDPPHDRFSLSSVHMNPKGWYNNRVEEGRRIGGTFWGSLDKSWIGIFYKAQKEFARVSDRLCLKWNDSRHPLEKVLIVFDSWKEVLRKKHFSSMKRGKTNTWWVAFVKI